MHPAVGLAVAYLIGSIPAAYLAGRARGVDLRAHGSGNLGATNALRVLDTILEVEAEWRKRIPTSQVNETLEALVGKLQPPQAAGREVRLIYGTQVQAAPPTIAIFGNAPDLVAEHYIRYLHNGFRAVYGFIGAPLKIVMRHKNAPDTDHRRVRGGAD